MKKIMTMIMLAVATTAMYANDEKNATENDFSAANYVINIADNSMARYLYLNEDQKYDVNHIHSEFMHDMQRAANATNAVKARKIARRAITSDLSQMRYVLDEWQFDRYKKVVAATISNHGIEY